MQVLKVGSLNFSAIALILMVSGSSVAAENYCGDSKNSYCRNGFCVAEAIRETHSISGTAYLKKGEKIQVSSNDDDELSQVHGLSWPTGDFNIAIGCRLPN